MIAVITLESTGLLMTILTPLMAVPLTAITFYLKSLRDQQSCNQAAIARRAEAVEQSVTDIRNLIADFERDYTTKEEWLRECMLARHTLEQLSETTVRLETMMHSPHLGSCLSPHSEDTTSGQGSHGRPQPGPLPGNERSAR